MDQFRVCVVDDCVEEAALLCEGLKLHNYEAIAVNTGEEGLRLCQEGGIDMVLLDVRLPDISGYEVCRRLKEDPATKDIAVIFVTAKGSERDIAQGYVLGAVDYIAKPYNLPFVMVRVELAIRALQSKSPVQSEGDHLLDLVYTDTLTGLRNRRFLLERLQEEAEKSHRHRYPISLLVTDVDEVKGLDEELGAASMDDVLVEVAMALRSASRGYDVLARVDGAMFAAILPHAGCEEAERYARKIQEEIDSTTLSEPSFPTTAKLSFGVVSCLNGKAFGAEEILGEGMRALLKAKSAGGDNIWCKALGQTEEPTKLVS